MVQRVASTLVLLQDRLAQLLITAASGGCTMRNKEGLKQ
jgi:hypothetical protein